VKKRCWASILAALAAAATGGPVCSRRRPQVEQRLCVSRDTCKGCGTQCGSRKALRLAVHWQRRGHGRLLYQGALGQLIHRRSSVKTITALWHGAGRAGPASSEHAAPSHARLARLAARRLARGAVSPTRVESVQAARMVTNDSQRLRSVAPLVKPLLDWTPLPMPCPPHARTPLPATTARAGAAAPHAVH
jgi:hypothetical protein